jgi:hypothetical protein
VHTPQPTHNSLCKRAFFFFLFFGSLVGRSSKAFTGHAFTHFPHPVHKSLSILEMKVEVTTLFKYPYRFNPLRKLQQHLQQ